MSRSYKKFPLISHSKKEDKQYSSRVLRHKVKQILNNEVPNCIESEWKNMIFYTEDFILPILKEVYDLWWNSSVNNNIAFDEYEFPKFMRK